MKISRLLYTMIFLPALSTGCYTSEKDNLAGNWNGEFQCSDRDYTVQMLIKENTERYVYKGQVIMQYEELISSYETFQAQFLYSFSLVQPIAAGAQDLIFEMTWDDIGCATVLGNGDSEPGGCSNHGINTNDLKTNVGDVEMRFNGISRLVIDDDYCVGALYKE
jgi:hypothetical protein